MLDEEKLRASSKWNSVADIPDLPFESFDQLKEAVSDGTYSLGVDRGRARELYPLATRSFAAQLVHEQVGVIGIWLAIASIVGALVLRNLWLLLGIPLGLISWWLATILHFQSGRPGSVAWLVGSFGTIGLIWAFWRASRVPFCLLTTAVLPFLSVGIVYSVSVKAVRSAILRSEALFLFLFEKHACMLRDNRTGRIYSYWSLKLDQRESLRKHPTRRGSGSGGEGGKDE